MKISWSLMNQNLFQFQFLILVVEYINLQKCSPTLPSACSPVLSLQQSLIPQSFKIWSNYIFYVHAD